LEDEKQNFPRISKQNKAKFVKKLTPIKVQSISGPGELVETVKKEKKLPRYMQPN
jgi:hypothetical protein